MWVLLKLKHVYLHLDGGMLSHSWRAAPAIFLEDCQGPLRPTHISGLLSKTSSYRSWAGVTDQARQVLEKM